MEDEQKLPFSHTNRTYKFPVKKKKARREVREEGVHCYSVLRLRR